MFFLRGSKEIPWKEKRRSMVKFLFSETVLPQYSPFIVINHQKRSTPPLGQLGNSSAVGALSGTPTSTASAISQPLAFPAPSEPSISSATASLNRHHHIQFLKHVIPCKTTRKRARPGDTATVAHSERIQKILAPSSEFCSMPYNYPPRTNGSS